MPPIAKYQSIESIQTPHERVNKKKSGWFFFGIAVRRRSKSADHPTPRNQKRRWLNWTHVPHHTHKRYAESSLPHSVRNWDKGYTVNYAPCETISLLARGFAKCQPPPPQKSETKIIWLDFEMICRASCCYFRSVNAFVLILFFCSFLCLSVASMTHLKGIFRILLGYLFFAFLLCPVFYLFFFMSIFSQNDQNFLLGFTYASVVFSVVLFL